MTIFKHPTLWSLVPKGQKLCLQFISSLINDHKNKTMHFFPYRPPGLIPNTSVALNKLNHDIFLEMVVNTDNEGPKGILTVNMSPQSRRMYEDNTLV
jgi:hypothetical protein